MPKLSEASTPVGLVDACAAFDTIGTLPNPTDSNTARSSRKLERTRCFPENIRYCKRRLQYGRLTDVKLCPPLLPFLFVGGGGYAKDTPLSGADRVVRAYDSLCARPQCVRWGSQGGSYSHKIFFLI